jgi:hypothetical protein
MASQACTGGGELHRLGPTPPITGGTILRHVGTGTGSTAMGCVDSLCTVCVAIGAWNISDDDSDFMRSGTKGVPTGECTVVAGKRAEPVVTPCTCCTDPIVTGICAEPTAGAAVAVAIAVAVAVAGTTGTRTFWHGDAIQRLRIGVGTAIIRIVSRAFVSMGEGMRQAVDGAQVMAIDGTGGAAAVAVVAAACGHAQDGTEAVAETVWQVCLGVDAMGVPTCVDKTVAERTGV